MSKPTERELWELSARLAEADGEDHEDDEVIQPVFDMLKKLSEAQQTLLFDLLRPKGQNDFKEALHKVCTSKLSYDSLEKLGIEDITIDKSDPAGIVYHIIVSSWEGEDGL